MDYSDIYVRRIRKLCKERHMAINELATLSGVTPSSVYSMMNPDRRELRISLIKKLCDGLDISLAEFFTAKVFDELEQEIR